MSLSRTVFWTIFLAVAGAVALEALSDAVLDRLRSAELRRLELRVAAVAAQFEARLERSPEAVGEVMRRFDAEGREELAWVPDGLEGKALAEGVVALEPGLWFRGEHRLSDGVAVEVAVQRGAWGRWLERSALLDLLDAPLLLAAAWLLALWGARRVRLRLQDVGQAIVTASQGRVPESIEPPLEDPELTRLVQAYNRMTEVAARYLEREQTFTRFAAHELRTPLAALNVQLERLEGGTASAHEVVLAMRRNLERMERMMGALLALTRGRSRSVNHEPLSLLVEDLVAGVGVDAERERRIQVDWGALPGVHRMRVVEPELVRQALENLLDNALRHTAGPVHLRLYRQGEVLTLRVRDFGSGVPEELLGRLTEPFFRAEGGSRSGLGLGLALVELVSRVLEGELTFEAAKPGLVATLRLPVVLDGTMAA